MKVYLLIGTPLNFEFADVYVHGVYISEELARQDLQVVEAKREFSRNKESLYTYQVQAWEVRGSEHHDLAFPQPEPTNRATAAPGY